MISTRFYLGLIVTALLPVGSAAQSVIYVDQSASGSGDGSSWSSAFIYLQDALTIVQPGDEIWVVYGVYSPDQGQVVTSGDREATFALSSGLKLYGGFSGFEKSIDERDLSKHSTILTGDLLRNDRALVELIDPDRMDNSLHVVTVSGTAASPTLDGFVVTNGHSFREVERGSFGGGIIAHNPVILRNLRLENNTGKSGAGLYLNSSDRHSIVENVTFLNNVASRRGGGMSTTGHADLRHVTFLINQAGESGGALYNWGTLTVKESLFVNNTGGEGGAMKSGECAQAYIANSIFSRNHALWGGGYHQEECDYTQVVGATFVNTLFNGNDARVGGAISSFSNMIEVFSSTIANNSAEDKGGGIYLYDCCNASVRISNSILWGNTATGYPDQLGNDSMTETPMYVYSSLIQGVLPSNVAERSPTMDSDPLFLDPDGADNIRGTFDDDYRLTSTSPAIDAGSEYFLTTDLLDLDQDGSLEEVLPVDLNMNVRVFDGGSGAAIVDIGAYEFDSPPVGTFIVRSPDNPSQTSTGIEVYPNPARDSVTLTWRREGVDEAILKLYDIAGREVMFVYQGNLRRSENFSFKVSALKPGVYVIRELSSSASTTLIVLGNSNQ